MTFGTASFCVACAALGAPPARFAWHAQHLEHLRFVLHGRRSTWSTFIEVRGSSARSDDFKGAASFCVAGAALGAPPARFCVADAAWSTSGSFLRGRCITWSTFIEVRGSPATSDDFGRGLVLRGRRSTEVSHYDDKASSKKLKNSWLTPRSRNATAITSLSQPSYPFCLIPPDILVFFFVVDCSLFCFVDLFHRWMSEDC